MAEADAFADKARRTKGVNYVKRYQKGFGKQAVMVCGDFDAVTEEALLEGRRNFA